LVRPWPAPGIHRHAALEVRSVPRRDPGRTFSQRRQALLARRVCPNVELEQVEHGTDAFYGLLGHRRAGACQLPQGGRCHQADKQTKNGDNDEDLEQCEARLTADVRLASGMPFWRVNLSNVLVLNIRTSSRSSIYYSL